MSEPSPTNCTLYGGYFHWTDYHQAWPNLFGGPRRSAGRDARSLLENAVASKPIDTQWAHSMLLYIEMQFSYCELHQLTQASARERCFLVRLIPAMFNRQIR